MSRKKVAKTVRKGKKTTRNQAKATVMSLAEKMEKNFKEIPTQLIAQYRKDAGTFKQQEKKLSVEIKKAQALAKAIQNKCMTLAKAKPGVTVKKQLTAAKQGHQKANHAIHAMMTKAEQIQKNIKALTDKEAKYAALAKELSQFDKQWTSKAKKQTNTTNKSKKKTKRQSHQAKAVTHERMTSVQDDQTNATLNEAHSDVQTLESVE